MNFTFINIEEYDFFYNLKSFTKCNLFLNKLKIKFTKN